MDVIYLRRHVCVNLVGTLARNQCYGDAAITATTSLSHPEEPTIAYLQKSPGSLKQFNTLLNLEVVMVVVVRACESEGILQASNLPFH